MFEFFNRAAAQAMDFWSHPFRNHRRPEVLMQHAAKDFESGRKEMPVTKAELEALKTFFRAWLIRDDCAEAGEHPTLYGIKLVVTENVLTQFDPGKDPGERKD